MGIFQVLNNVFKLNQGAQMKRKILTVMMAACVCSPLYAEDANTMTTQPTATTQTQTQTPKQLGEQFLNTNKTKKGVVALPDGLQYKVLKQGSGPKPAANDVVTVNYEGHLINGQEFDSSAKHGGPAQFPVGQVIPGWVEAIQMMPVGSTWEIYVPENLAYGDQGAPPAIGPNEALIFKITLLKTEKQ